MTRIGIVGVFAAAAVVLVVSAAAQELPKTMPAGAPEVAAPKGPEAVVETPKGSFTIRLLPDVAPEHVKLFVKTAKAGGYDGTTFHRIIMGGIIQGGDPLSKDADKASQYGTGGLGLLKAEFSDRPFVKGTVAAARRPSDVDSAGTQFFVCVNDQPSLKGQYTVFGEVTDPMGLYVVGQISTTPVDGDKATERVEMTVTIQSPER
ncbi:MAG: peptidylprolyl isomerase [Acidobacteriota bacterium]|jgi:peptidyl-prolyl cis-trans isomerase B (cyclophilin B)